MLERLRMHLGSAGLVVAIVALVVASVGGAYAAKKADKEMASASATKKGPRGPKGPKGAKGAPGATGPAGPQGPAGANGKDGANGANGKDGTSGTAGSSVTAAKLNPGNANCADGGSEFKAGATTTFACNGAEGEAGEEGEKGEKGDEGSPWTLGGTLPSGATETGTWGFGPMLASQVPFVSEAAEPTEAEENREFAEKIESLNNPLRVMISFAIPLAEKLPDPQVHYLDQGYPTGASAEEIENCPGSAADPQAKKGHLCVYVANRSAAFPDPEGSFVQSTVPLDPVNEGGTKPGASTTGAYLPMIVLSKGARATGTFAVTGE